MMNHKRSTSLVLGGMLVLSAGLLRAQQEPPPPPPPPGAMMRGGGPASEFMAAPMGERIELLGFEGMHGGKVVTGAPFSAVAVSESTQTLADGNHISRKTQTNLFRDSHGRFRKEVTLPAIGPLATSGQPKSFVFINDPVAQENFVLHPEDKTAERMGFGGMKGAMKDKLTYWKETSTAGAGYQTEDLGTHTIAAVSAHGTKYTRTIPAGQIGNEKPITIISEQWYSSDLQVTVMSKRSDPRFGETTYILTNIERSEPGASLFAVPSDFTIREVGKGGHGMMKFKHGSPPSDN